MQPRDAREVCGCNPDHATEVCGCNPDASERSLSVWMQPRCRREKCAAHGAAFFPGGEGGLLAGDLDQPVVGLVQHRHVQMTLDALSTKPKTFSSARLKPARRLVRANWCSNKSSAARRKSAHVQTRRQTCVLPGVWRADSRDGTTNSRGSYLNVLLPDDEGQLLDGGLGHAPPLEQVLHRGQHAPVVARPRPCPHEIVGTVGKNATQMPA